MFQYKQFYVCALVGVLIKLLFGVGIVLCVGVNL